jgi:hypothetical protein
MPSPVGTWVVSPPGLIRTPKLAERPPPKSCKVFTASYGGEKNILIRRRVGQELQFTALQVLSGREHKLAEAFIRSHAVGGEAIGEFANRKEALADAFTRCPAAARVTAGSG